jgi:hypothetical protein
VNALKNGIVTMDFKGEEKLENLQSFSDSRTELERESRQGSYFPVCLFLSTPHVFINIHEITDYIGKNSRMNIFGIAECRPGKLEQKNATSQGRCIA